jgi:hypothetical protein
MNDLLVKMVKDSRPTFAGAKPRHTYPNEYGNLQLIGLEWGKKAGIPGPQAITMACGVYWTLWNEHGGK